MSLFRKRWVLRDYYLPTCEVVSQSFYRTRRRAEFVRWMHGRLCPHHPDFLLRIERI